jgi:hypothetical protein
MPAGDGPALAPRDLQAGGTWLGVKPGGLFVALTNRRDGNFEPDRRSRGWLCDAALYQPDCDALQRWLEVELAARPYNSFNLFFADRRQARVASWNGSLEVAVLAPGVHVLSNEHGLDAVRLPELEGLDWRGASIPELQSELVSILGSHRARDARGWSVCKHGERYGTVCSSLAAIPDAGPGRLDWAPGPPCRTAFEPFVLAAGESV